MLVSTEFMGGFWASFSKKHQRLLQGMIVFVTSTVRHYST